MAGIEGSLWTRTKAVLKFLAVFAPAALAWLATEFLPEGRVRVMAIMTFGAWLLWPIRYRAMKHDERIYWIYVPYLFAGFCELAVVIFDRYKPSQKS